MSLKDYIKNKFIENSYLKTILKKDSPVIDMFIEVGENFGYGDTKKEISCKYNSYGYYSEDIAGYYFTNQILNGIKTKMAYVTYITGKDNGYGTSVYMTKDGTLYKYNYSTHVGTRVDTSVLDTKELLDKYNNYLKVSLELDKDKEESKTNPKIEYMFIGDNKDKKFFYGTDNNFYMSEKNGKKVGLNKDTAEFLFCKDVWSNLEKLV